MNTARSARTLCVLGATLIAIATPQLAVANNRVVSVASITGADVTSITGADVTSITGADNALLAGPVDSIDQINGVFESMGQIVMASQTMLSGMQVGDFVSVSGSVVSAGWLYADGISVSSDRYVPGATEVFVTGLLSSVNREMGTAQIGGLTIDYTASLGDAGAPSAAIWSFKGIRPAQSGVMLSDRSGARH